MLLLIETRQILILRRFTRETIEAQGWVGGHPLLISSTEIAQFNSMSISFVNISELLLECPTSLP